jgi:hypothetical protein
MQIQTGDDVFGDRPCVTPRRGAEVNAGAGERGSIDVVDAGGGSADKAQTAVGDECGIDLGDRAHQQHLGIAERGAIEFATFEQPQLTERGEVRRDRYDFLVGEDVQRIAPGGAAAAKGQGRSSAAAPSLTTGISS